MSKTAAKKAASPAPAPAPAAAPAPAPAEQAQQAQAGTDQAAEDAKDLAALEQAQAADQAAVQAGAPPAPPVMGGGWYVVVSRLAHDGTEYEAGAELQLSEPQAEPLLGHTVKPKQNT